MPTERSGTSPDEQVKILRAKREWEQTFDAVSDLIFILDTDHSIVRANRAMAERCGRTPRELVGCKCYDVIHDSGSVPDYCPHARLLKLGEPQTVEFESDKLRGTFEITMSPIRNAEGEVTASVHVARDVTDKRKTENALQEIEQSFSVFMRHLPLAVSIKDDKGRFLFANEYLKDLFRVEDMIGLTALDLLPPAAAAKTAKDDREALTQGLGLYADVISDYDGYELVFDSYKFPIPRQDGTDLLGTISLDVTEKRHHEELLEEQQKQLEEVNSSLETRINEAVAELRKRDDILIQESRLNAMGEMISTIAHQWRQPLNNIGLIVQSLRIAFKSKDLTEQELDEDIDDTMKVLQQMSETIDDFRNFFSHEGEAGPLFINELVFRAISFVQPSFSNKGIRIELDEEPNVTAEGYPNEYVQALLNIILNSRDALLEHQPARPLMGIRVFREKGRSVVLVRDNGGGIPEEALPKIFDPYFTTKPQGKGTGIGLYMSKMIIEKKMLGCLTALNVAGGAEFRIEV